MNINRRKKIRLGGSKTRRLLNGEGEGKVVRKPCERLSGHGSSPLGEESEALNRAAFASLGQKRRAFEPLCLSHSNGFLTTRPDQF
jgi:hypothetical protein